MNLAQAYPELAKEWHPVKNGMLTPNDVSPHSGKDVWWCCSKEKGHEWSASVNNRSKGRGCPYCSGKRLTETTCLANRLPALASEWHPTKNGNLSPQSVAPHSHKKVWWLCQKDNSHEWAAVINNRANGATCPYCSGHLFTKDTCFAVRAPKIAAEWHPTKNGNLTPYHVSKFAHSLVWWRCAKKGHEYQSSVANRTNRGSGCPYCSGNLPTPETCLAAVYPEVAKEWHPTKNGSLSPQTETASAAKCVWWRCSKCGHVWKATVNNRARGSGCPRCNRGNQSSIPELRIWSELAHVFGEENVISRFIDLGFELDIFIKSINVGIEYDGYRWHSDSHASDAKKFELAQKHDIFLIRVSEQPEAPADRVFIAKVVTPALIRQIVVFLHNFDYLNTDTVRKYISTDGFQNEELFKKASRRFPKNNISTLESVCVYFDYERNFPLTPFNFSQGSDCKVWWRCSVCGDSWQRRVYKQVGSVGCFVCWKKTAKRKRRPKSPPSA